MTFYNISLVTNVTHYSRDCPNLTSPPNTCHLTFYNDSSASLPTTDNNNNNNDTTTSSLELEEMSSSALMIFFLVLYSLICLFGTIGNSLVMYVVARYPKMRSVTNTYIVNLALADCCFLVGLPMLIVTAVKQMWIFGNAMCKIYMILTSVNWFTSVFTLTVLSADRYFAVCHAIRSMQYRTEFSARLVCSGVWFVSLLAMTPVIIYSEEEIDFPSNHSSCVLRLPLYDWLDIERVFTLYIFILAFVLPVGLISVFYALVVVRLRRSGPNKQTVNKKRSNKKVTQMVLAVIAVYVCCWSPYYIFQAVLLYGHTPTETTRLLFQILTVLTYSNSAFNPLLYAFLSDNFRRSFLTTVHCAGLSRQNELQSSFERDGMTSFAARKSTVGGVGEGRGSAAFVSLIDTVAKKLSSDGLARIEDRPVAEINDRPHPGGDSLESNSVNKM